MDGDSGVPTSDLFNDIERAVPSRNSRVSVPSCSNCMSERSQRKEAIVLLDGTVNRSLN